MAAIGVFDVTKRMAFASVIHNKTAGPMVAEHSQLMTSKRTAFASVRYNTSGPFDVAQLMHTTKRAAFASVRNKTPYPIVAKQKREACVSVVNNSNYPLVGVSVLHKYSSLYKNQHQWGLIRPGESGEDWMDVEYHTGWLTTGMDWWLITWYSQDMRKLYYSDPNNFSGFLDTLESFAPEVIATAAGVVAGFATSLTGPGAIAAASVAAVAAKATTNALFSSESIAGFKEHMLKEEDEGNVTEIIINRDLTITFKSPSGVSNTVSSSKPVPVKH